MGWVVKGQTCVIPPDWTLWFRMVGDEWECPRCGKRFVVVKESEFTGGKDLVPKDEARGYRCRKAS